MKVEFNLKCTCLNCDKEINPDYQICSIACLYELAECARKQGVKSHYGKSDVWKK